ncbi:glutathione S-transferase [Hahella sp. KA22]|uniref:glutathione S-transferase family protein n=1 Tax=Hahella sp. KA22 TaxID=1628392 RepID=UPI000FDF415E|nr:glutathione S-transferase [Hahella sp. KA22]AZZ93808.1 glutathione S-transferase [Hahella sp. KA22]QAY57181.1 glutathione S-transferase [Hahella sp. KA22]
MIILYQFPISHFCEKARWALDYKGLEYKVKNLMPGAHIKAIKKLADKSTVPVIEHDGRIVQGSAEIINYLDELSSERPLTPVEPGARSAALEWEKYLDREIGVSIRCYCYHYLLTRPDQVIPMLAHHGPWYGKWLLRLGFGKLSKIMRKHMRINDETAADSLRRIQAALARINERVGNDGYLVGDYFTRADLTAASLLTPFLQPESFDIPWPQDPPPALAQTVKELEPQLEWARRIYARYR